MGTIKKACIALVTCIFITGCSFFVEEHTYYIPQTKIYVKTIFKGGEKSGYILFSRDSIMDLSKDIDYVKSSIDLSAIFILNPNHPDSIGIYYNGNVIELNQVKFHFIKDIRETDTLRFEKRYKTKPLISKEPYFKFVVSDYFHMAWIKVPGVESFTEIQPIK